MVIVGGGLLQEMVAVGRKVAAVGYRVSVVAGMLQQQMVTLCCCSGWDAVWVG